MWHVIILPDMLLYMNNCCKNSTSIHVGAVHTDLLHILIKVDHCDQVIYTLKVNKLK